MAEKLCPEYQKLVIPSTGQNKMQVGGLASLCMEKNCKTKSGKLTNANSIKRLIPLGQRKEHKCTPCPPSRPFSTWAANCYIHPKSLIQTDVLVQLLGWYSAVQIPLISVFNQIIWIKRATSTERWHICLLFGPSYSKVLYVYDWISSVCTGISSLKCFIRLMCRF